MKFSWGHFSKCFGAGASVVGVVLVFCGELVASDRAEVEVKVAQIRRHYAEVEALQELRQDDIEFQCQNDPMQGVLTRRSRRDTGEIVRLDLGYLAGDHGGADEMYYYRGSEVFFVLDSASWWGFSGKKEGQTIDTMRERRFYFAEGRCIRVLEKKVSSEKPEGLKALITKAENQELDLADAATMEMVAEILRKAVALPKLTDAKAVAKFFCEE